VVNEHLEGHVSPVVFPSFLEDKERRGKVYFRPDSLLSAMWLLVLDEITGVLELLRCDNCGKWFKRKGNQGGKRESKYCCGNCRKTGNRRKRGQDFAPGPASPGLTGSITRIKQNGEAV